MEKILTPKEKWAYARYCAKPKSVFLLLSPVFWLALFFTSLMITLSMDLCIEMFRLHVWQYISKMWYARFVAFYSILIYVITCVFVSFTVSFYIVALWIFCFDKDEFYQKFFKRSNICHKLYCYQCDRNDCSAKLLKIQQ